jgi:hypothetical protein
MILNPEFCDCAIRNNDDVIRTVPEVCSTPIHFDHFAVGASSKRISSPMRYGFSMLSDIPEKTSPSVLWSARPAGRSCARMPRTCSTDAPNKLDYRHTIRLTHSGAPASRTFLENDGTLEAAQRIAGHADSRTTKLYDRRGQKVLLEDIERIRYS